MDMTSAISGEKLLRNIMLDNNIELYAAYVSNHYTLFEILEVLWILEMLCQCELVFQGKVMNCGGGGSCGTCIVEVFICTLYTLGLFSTLFSQVKTPTLIILYAVFEVAVRLTSMHVPLIQ